MSNKLWISLGEKDGVQYLARSTFTQADRADLHDYFESLNWAFPLDLCIVLRPDQFHYSFRE